MEKQKIKLVLLYLQAYAYGFEPISFGQLNVDQDSAFSTAFATEGHAAAFLCKLRLDLGSLGDSDFAMQFKPWNKLPNI
jgi:hypothetical protein